MKKRLLSFILVGVMLVSFLPLPAAAEGQERTITSCDDLASILVEAADTTETINVTYSEKADFVITGQMFIPDNIWLNIPFANLVIARGSDFSNSGIIQVGSIYYPYSGALSDIIIEAGASMDNYYLLECAGDVVISGTLNQYEDMELDYRGVLELNGNLTINEGGKLYNEGSVRAFAYGPEETRNTLTISGTYEAEGEPYYYGNSIHWVYYAQSSDDLSAFLEDRILREAANPDVAQYYEVQNSSNYMIYDSPCNLTVTNDIELPADTLLDIIGVDFAEEGIVGGLTVAEGCKLTLGEEGAIFSGPVYLDGTLHSDYVMILNALESSVTLGENGVFEGHGFFWVYAEEFANASEVWEKYLHGFDPTQFLAEPDIEGYSVFLKYGGTTACAHAWNTGTVLTAAACTADGLKKLTCINCGAEKTEPIPALGHTPDGNTDCSQATLCAACRVTLKPAGEHIWDNGVVIEEVTCIVDGVKLYTCISCKTTRKETLSAPGHSWDDGVQTIEPTFTSAGERLYTCTVCRATKTEDVPSLEDSGYVLDLKPYLNKAAQKSVTLKGSQYFTNTKKNNQAKKKTSAIHQTLFVRSLTQASLQNADAATVNVVQGQIQDLLYKAKYRPGIFGSTEEQRDDWPVQNDDYGNGVYSVYDSGLGLRVGWDCYCAGCLSYGRFFSNYVYGCDGVRNTYYLKDTTGSKNLTTVAAMTAKFHELMDPGETLYYSTKSTAASPHYHSGTKCNRYHHAIVFLGESIDGKGFYFASYNGGMSWGSALHGIYVGYFPYEKFYNDVYQLRLYNANGGSYYQGTAKTLSLNSKTGCGKVGKKTTLTVLKAQCPVEIVVTLGTEVLDSRKLSDGQSGSTNFGSMTVSGTIGGDRSITVQLKGPMEDYAYDIAIIGTDEGTMDLTVTSTYQDDNLEEAQTETQFFQDIPITNATTIVANGLSVLNTTELTVSAAEGTETVYTLWSTDETGIGFTDDEAENFSPEALPEMNSEPEVFFAVEAETVVTEGTAEVSLAFEGDGAEDYSALALVCFYDGDRLCQTQIHTIEICDSQASLQLYNITSNEKCIVFFVSDAESMAPVSKPVTIFE